MERVHLFGIRHHGPGSARSLLAALEALHPDALLIEGPPDAEGVLSLAASQAMQPPVALLLYAPDEPGRAAYYPFAAYSPEWQAICYGLANGIPPRMIDLPQSVQMAMSRQWEREMAEKIAQPPDPAEVQASEGSEPAGQAAEIDVQPSSQPEPPADEITAEDPDPGARLPDFDPTDPLRMLAEAAGYSEGEQWWEHLVEQRRAPGDTFAAILEAMTALRDSLPTQTDAFTATREAAMRQAIRAALAHGYERIAVVCGAWHTPALNRLDAENAAETDAALLKGLPQIEVRATWVPWTNARLTRQSGYGAGIDSPGWYEHLWCTESDVAARWMIRVAQLLRAEDVDISPAHVIEAVRLAEALAALRDRPLPGLPELNEAALTVFCFGNPLPMRLIEEKLIVGDQLGRVPPETPMAPLQQDFEHETKRLKMAPEAIEKLLDLDLRRPLDLERSHLLHRLNLLDLPWGKNSDAALQASGHGRSGTFHEIWRLKWLPEFAVQLIEAGQWGNTLAEAASARVRQTADQADNLSVLSGLVEDVLLAELPEAIEHVMRCLQAQTAVSSDMRHLMQAFPPLASVLRYGNVRRTDTAMIDGVVEGLSARMCIGLPGACTLLNEDAAGEMFELILAVDDAYNRLSETAYREAWQQALARVADLPNVHGLIAGRACRILMDGGALTHADAAGRLGLALSAAVEPIQAAGWVEGFLKNSGQLLIHDDRLLEVVDGWLSSLTEPVFTQLLPLLRRTFSSFARPERRSIGERVKRGRSSFNPGTANQAPNDFDQAQADAVLPLLAMLLGIEKA